NAGTSKNSFVLHTCTEYSTIERSGMCAVGNYNYQCIPCVNKKKCKHQQCEVTINKASGFAFNNYGGGVYACEWILDGSIRMWFFPRSVVNKYILEDSNIIDTKK